ncbi:MAG: glycosyl hydrolase [Gemmatimonadota bacterium]|nr:MAG: glycosyl hydrolase [Gemmatimonadota bacterium]
MLRYACTLAVLLALAGNAHAQRRPRPAGPASVEARRAAWERHQELNRATLFKGLAWRDVGPVVQGGRLVDIEAVPGEPYTFYVAYASGGVWKTTNNGVSFEPLFDDQPAIIIGDMALDPTDPQRIFVGTGENNSSRSSYGGAGVFRSQDAGETWAQVGLEGSDRIGRIIIDPRNPNRIFVAALGKLYTPGGQRGVYRSDDGGDSWDLVLAGENELTGFSDIAFQPGNPDVIYAAAWERVRRPWDFVEGGEGTGVWRSADGGDSWERLSGGFPRGEHVGRIGLAVTPADPQVLYASVDNQEVLPEDEWDLGDDAVTPKRLRAMDKEEFLAQDPDEIESFLRGNDLDPRLDAQKLIDAVRGDSITMDDLLNALRDANESLFQTDIRGIEVWRSDDAGASWRRMNPEPIREAVYTYGYYFGQIRVAPDDVDRVYVLGVPLLGSEDGGVTWRQVAGREVHGDHQALWIDPEYPQHLILGNDGGLDVTFDGGATWLTLSTVSVGQFYTVSVDMADPYNIYGGLQDNGVLKGSSRTRPNITASWERVGGGDGMWAQIDPRDNRTYYAGSQFGNYFRRGPAGFQRVKPRNGILDEPLRYNWLTPILLSSHNADVLYYGANRLYRSMDQGETWTALSDDLSRSENRGDVPFATITVLAESPLRFGLLWVGTDDGHVYVTRGSGADWTEVSAGLPSDRWVSRVEASRFDENVAYVSLNGYRDDDIAAYVYRTADLGRTWQDISAGLPDEPVNVIREDPVKPAVLYVGTDRGAYVSLDTGRTWQAAGAGLPKVPVHDLIVHPRERELVAGTHGRSVWVLDALPIQELSDEVSGSAVHIFPLEPIDYQRSWRSRRSLWYYRPEDAPYQNIPFWVVSDGRVEWSVLDSDERVLRHGDMDAVRGVNTLRWDLLLDEELALAAESARLEGEEEPAKKDMLWSEAVRLGRQLYATPGAYTIRVEAAGGSADAEFTVKPPRALEPRVKPEPRIRGQKEEEKRGR